LCLSYRPFFSVSFGEMGLQWETIPTNIQSNLEEVSIERGNDFSVRGLSGFVKGSSGMNYRWDENYMKWFIMELKDIMVTRKESQQTVRPFRISFIVWGN
jgi:ABC-type amino acid transport system permease subunit